MFGRWISLPAALLLLVAACSSPGSGSGSGGPGKPAGSAAVAARKGDAPGGAALANPEENYLAAATKLGCLGLELESADIYARERTEALQAHAYTEESWKAASRQYGTAKGEAIVAAMAQKCPD